MHSGPAALPTVISYVRGPHDDQVIALAERLIRDGVPCDLDLFDPRPRGGWSRWMTEKMTGTDVVLVVCSEAYHRRYHLEEQPGIGKGATYEGGMLNRRVLDAQGSEHGVIPVVFDRADLKWIPEFLRDETYFVLPEQFDDLYRVLTRQPQFVKPPLGEIRRMPPQTGAFGTPLAAARPQPRPDTPHATRSTTPSQPLLPLAVFDLGGAKLVFAHYAELVREKGAMKMNLLVEDDEDAANFPRLRAPSGRLAVGWGLEAALVRVREYREIHRAGKRIVELSLAEEPRPSSFTSEITYNGITPDQIALRRARRILLDEAPVSPPDVGTFSAQRMNEDMLEHYVSGEAGGLAVTGSPIPGIVRGGNEPAVTVQVIRVVCALLLVVTNTVERITRFEVQPVPGGVSVDFVGVRARQYSNVEPTVLTVTGVCPVA